MIYSVSPAEILREYWWRNIRHENEYLYWLTKLGGTFGEHASESAREEALYIRQQARNAYQDTFSLDVVPGRLCEHHYRVNADGDYICARCHQYSVLNPHV